MATKKRPAPRRIPDAPGGATGTGTPVRGSNAAATAKTAGSGTRAYTRQGGRPAPADRPATGGPRGKTSGSMPVLPPRRGISPRLLGLGGAGVVIVVLVIIIVVAVTGNSTPPPSGPATLSAQAIQEATHVPASVLNQVGIGGNPISSTLSDNALNVAKGTYAASAALPKVDGKPQFFYYGAEWCPYCATERWSMVIALSRFGTFSGLKGVKSYPTDYAPNTNTFTFYGSHYTSPYIAFVPVEGEDQAKNPLMNTTAAQTSLLNTWDTANGQPGAWSFPFIDVAGKYVGAIASWDNPLLLQHLTWNQIASVLSQPSNPAGQELDAAANYLTAAICNVTGQQPSDVCSSSGVVAAAKQLAKAPTALPLDK